MTDFATIELHSDPRGIATLWLNRADKHNAFDAAMIAELIQALRQVADDDSLRFLLLRGRGRHFSAGADLAWMQASAGLDYAANLKDAHQLGELMSLLYHLPCPTLAVVQGAAFGGAVGLAACCDIAIGARDASFSLSEVRIGLAPAVISPYVVQAIGERAARRYALSAERFSGERARELGLLAECYPAAELEAALEQWLANLLQNGPQAMRASKALLLDVGSGVLGDALRQRSESVIAGIRVSAEGQEGLNAFLEKRKPAWQ
ncbi:gamma-carboxygeranoyl-CoA hydratase [Phytopseudomonas dryadis]|uniref:Gamma-carboxygeranoyl-CoA hydratase n=1 Tax=Phytopseudomonas dryadis TaxID=2487520 RepID=A0A4Q9QTZ2_9GAMM|nr:MULTISPECIES: gamma-carboxygeranoyl-CoA hydratase [Pseudomonas]TBU86698.1 gamma-carboxygeranoyl-CoA hydratase [Pseudomonas dryadis]TBV05441.1 gamma-carboxygeranoyl-CoA hydratase [Pseudomonas dryadis]TBV18450.1 gamma-carboxygeranoyl-CoA hydratase [Pseudomonas sp. FRB 230]